MSNPNDPGDAREMRKLLDRLKEADPDWPNTDYTEVYRP